MVSGGGHYSSGRRLAAWVLLFGFVVFLGWHAYVLLVGHSEFGTVERLLPDLPQVHSVTHRRDPAFPIKVWVHRVNSVERAVRMAKEYEGMEIDVVYDSSAGYFDVGHPPTPSAGLSLDRLLAAVPDIGSHYFWIDFRNLTDANAPAACGLLLAIARKYGIVGNMIVESINPKALSIFTTKGFYTSYYLFPASELDTMNPGQVTMYYKEVKANLASSNVNALSVSYRGLPFVAKYFPDGDILTWYRERDRDLRYYATLAYLKRQSRVKVILVRQMSRGYR
jgi:hypothetical protein